jgi:hypothetical protein
MDHSRHTTHYMALIRVAYSFVWVAVVITVDTSAVLEVY